MFNAIMAHIIVADSMTVHHRGLTLAHNKTFPPNQKSYVLAITATTRAQDVI